MLVETLIATLLLSGCLVAVAQLFVASTQANAIARSTTFATVLAGQKLEQLRSLTWGHDIAGLRLTDATSDVTRVPDCPTGGTGLTPSPPGALRANTPGFVDYLDAQGRWVGTGATVAPGAVYIRRWSIEPLPTSPVDTLVFQVLVMRVREASAAGEDLLGRLPEEARVIDSQDQETGLMIIASAPGRAASASGFSVLEMLVATGIILGIIAGVLSLVGLASGAFYSQPEVSDMQQRLRVAVDALARDLLMAGAGMYSGAAAGPLGDYFAPVMPYRLGARAEDPPGTFKNDTVTLVSVPPTAAQTTTGEAVTAQTAQFRVNVLPGCPAGDEACGFEAGMSIVVFDGTGAWETFTVTEVQGAALSVRHIGQASTSAYAAGSYVAQARLQTYHLKIVASADTCQLMHYDGEQTDSADCRQRRRVGVRVTLGTHSRLNCEGRRPTRGGPGRPTARNRRPSEWRTRRAPTLRARTAHSQLRTASTSHASPHWLPGRAGWCSSAERH